MPRTTIAVTSLTRDDGGAVPMVAFDKVNGMSIDNSNQKGRIILTNTDSNPKNIEFSTDKEYDASERTLVEKTYTVPANTPIFMIPPLPNSYFGQSGNVDNMHLDLATADTTTGLTIGFVETDEP